MDPLLLEIQALTKRLKWTSKTNSQERANDLARLSFLLKLIEDSPQEAQEVAIKGIWRLAQVSADEWDRAYARLESLAGEGNVDAIYRLGLHYRDRKEYATAAQWLQQADRLDHPLAAFNVGYLYLRFDGTHDVTEERLALAKRYMERSATRWNDPEAYAYLSMIHKFGLGTPVDPEQSRACLLKAVQPRADQRVVSFNAHAVYGFECVLAGKFDEALPHLLTGAIGPSGRGDAKLNAARLLLSENLSDAAQEEAGIMDPDVKAYELLRSATDSRRAGGFKFLPPVLYELSKLLAVGRGCDENAEESYKLLQLAADQGHLPAIRRLIVLLADDGKTNEVEHYRAMLPAAEKPVEGGFKAWSSPDFETRREAHVDFFNEMNELVDAGEFVTAFERITALYRWAEGHTNDRHAAAIARDAGIRYVCGKARQGLGDTEGAILDFKESAQNKADPRHVSMCFQSMAECSALGGRYADAARYYYEGFLASHFPDMWIKHARALFEHNPKLRHVALLKIKAFMERDNSWREEGGRLPIKFPVDDAPSYTCVAYAELLWRMSDSEVSEADIVRTRDQLLFHLRRKASETGKLDTRIVYTLARGARHASIRAEICRLIENVGTGAAAPAEVQSTFPFPILSATGCIPLMNALRGGLWRSNGYTAELALSAVRRIAKCPEMIRTTPELGRELAHVLWRCILQTYYRGAADDGSFRTTVSVMLLPLVAIFFRRQDNELLRDWMFELVATDKASVEYGLVADFLEAVQDELLEHYTADFRSVVRTLREHGLRDLHDLSGRLLAPDAMLAHPAFGDLAADTAEYVTITIPQFTKRLLEFSVRKHGVKFYVRMDDSFDQAKLVSTAARIDLTVLLGRVVSEPGPLRDLLLTAKQINVDGRWQEPGVLDLRLRCSASSADAALIRNAQDALRQAMSDHHRIVRSVSVAMMGGRRDPSVRLVVDLRQGIDIATIPDSWREYLIGLIQEQREHRRNDMSFPGLYRALRAEMPEVSAQASTPLDCARAWALLLHAVCDRFHTFFAGTLLRSDSSARSPVGALHDIKTRLARLLDSVTKNALTEADLIDFRRRVRTLTPTAEELLKKSLAGWRPSNFDLKSEMLRPAGSIEQVFGQDREACEVTGVERVFVKAPKRQVLDAMSELLANARVHRGDQRHAPPVSIEFVERGVVVSNRAGWHDGGPAPFSTGKGASTAEAWLQECGFSVQRNSDGKVHSVRVTAQPFAIGGG